MQNQQSVYIIILFYMFVYNTTTAYKVWVREDSVQECPIWYGYYEPVQAQVPLHIQQSTTYFYTISLINYLRVCYTSLCTS